MTQMTIPFRSFSNPPAPGDVIREKILDTLRVSQAELASAMQISPPRLNMILKGRCPLTPEIALRLSQVSGISPHYWLRVRSEFELFVEEQRLSEELGCLRSLASEKKAQANAWLVRNWQVAA